MSYFPIKKFLERIKGVQNKNTIVKNTVIEAIKNKTLIEITEKSIITSFTVVKLSGISLNDKSVIFIKKQAILDEINAKLKNIAFFSDIK